MRYEVKIFIKDKTEPKPIVDFEFEVDYLEDLLLDIRGIYNLLKRRKEGK